jgi:hypothetical protein
MMLVILKKFVLILTLICINSDTIACSSKNGNSDGMRAFRAQSSARGKGTLMPAATFACKLMPVNYL